MKKNIFKHCGRNIIERTLLVLSIACTSIFSLTSCSKLEEQPASETNMVTGENELLGEFTFTTGSAKNKPSDVKMGAILSNISIGDLQSEYTNNALALSDWVKLYVGGGKWFGFKLTNLYGYEFEVDSVAVIMRRSDNQPDKIRLSYGDDKQNTTQYQGVIIEAGSSVYETYVLKPNPAKKPDHTTPFFAIGVEADSRETTVEFDKVSIYGRVTEADLPTSGYYTIRFDQPRQVIEGLGVEIQSDRFGPNYVNSDPVSGVPYELIDTEKQRLAEVLTGFRYLRMAMGLWFRGTTEDRKNIIERYPGQLQSIKNLIADADMEGISMEYWSPAPFWKSTDDFRNGTLKSFDPGFLSDFGDAVVSDMEYLQNNGITISTWGLQNEPALKATGGLETDEVGGYSHAYYTPENYLATFKSVAPKVRATAPNAEIIVDSWDGNVGAISRQIKDDAAALPYVDAWVYHRIGRDANTLIEGQSRYLWDNKGKPIYQNEYEYFDYQVDRYTGEWRMVNTAQSVMNWMTFINSPKWYWLHALKPINSNWEGFGLGMYRSLNDNNFTQFPDMAKGTFQLNWRNYNALAGFLTYMPWDSRRYEVDEEEVLYNQRIMVWKKPDGKFVYALTNRSNQAFEFNITLDGNRTFTGHRYNKDELNETLQSVSGSEHSITLEPWSIEFWVED
ncbi:hypothetical protein [Sinomicrobium weinanense]|uniref:O-Glycosyl hydrolase n=1 Tax=Sinomicrobium weinanense TaxID=2842200 RepID=A0A926JWL9_9FLAO|nr:hypothetical protein [Sinomicrobium weinanense]MBC9798528.1 hypothetical protein [Sinomicrobium weinanense]MBU3125827.1 hypothetical protein [Sinomicrobium weinanense]